MIFLPAFRLCLLAVISIGVNAKVHHVYPGNSIQDSLNKASDGDSIKIRPGTYTEKSNGLYGLRVSKNNIKLIAKGEPGSVRIIAAPGQETGIYVAPAKCDFTDQKCSSTLTQFYIKGIAVENFPKNGIQTRWVDGFKIIKSKSINNLQNGIYPTLSSNGVIFGCESSGSLDSGLWVAGSDNVTVKNTEIHHSTTGFEVTVSRNLHARNNTMHDNVVGIGLYHPNMAGTNPDLPAFDNWIFENNTVFNNNLQNMSPPGTFQSFLPSGIGIVMVGVSGHTIKKNLIQGNDSAGIVAAGYCTTVEVIFSSDCTKQPPKNDDPSLNNNTFAENILGNNGGNPDKSLPFSTTGLDIVYAQRPEEIGQEGDLNCFQDNMSLDGETSAVSFAVAVPFSDKGCGKK